jgi:serine/threonine protein kinase
MITQLSHFSFVLNRSKLIFLIWMIVGNPTVSQAGSIGDCVPANDRDGASYSIVSSTRIGSGGFGVVYEIEAVNSDTKEKQRFVLKTIDRRNQEIGQQSAKLLTPLYRSAVGARFNRIIDSKMDCYFKDNAHAQPVTRGILLERADGSLEKIQEQLALKKTDVADLNSLENKIGIYEKLESQLSEALLGLENEHLVHGDIKPGNILYHIRDHTKKLSAQSIDFQLTDFDSLQKEGGIFQMGTKAFLAPEYSSDNVMHVDKSLDHFSTGRTIEKVMFDENRSSSRSSRRTSRMSSEITSSDDLQKELDRIDQKFSEFDSLRTSRPDLYDRMMRLKSKIKQSMNFDPKLRLHAFSPEMAQELNTHKEGSTADRLIRACNK